MGTNRAILLLLLLVFCYGVTMAMEYREMEEEMGREKRREDPRERGDWFLFQDSKCVVKTEAGVVRVMRSLGGKIIDRPMHIGFITMQPKTLFIPQYLDSSLILFVRRGEARLGLVWKDELVERQLSTGDIFRIPAGSAFYLVNTGEEQRLRIICSIDPSESLGLHLFQPFYIGGGTYPTSVLAGFDSETLETAFNVSISEIKQIMTKQQGGPIVYTTDHAPSIWTKFLQLKEQDRLQHLKRIKESQRATHEENQEQATWLWRKLLGSIFRQATKENDGSPDSYNLYSRNPDFKNSYGWSVALDGSAYSPLKHSGIGIYYVNLSAGSMLAPHLNPTATEYGIVLRGSGRLQIVHPNGTSAMNARVKRGDVFCIPRYFAFCQIASRRGPFEFFGFTTSAHKSRPQFLVGANSLLHSLNGPELAAAFGASEKNVRRVIDAQHEAVILPAPSAAPPDLNNGHLEKKTEREQEIIKALASDMVMGFD